MPAKAGIHCIMSLFQFDTFCEWNRVNMLLKQKIELFLRPNGKVSFLSTLDPKAKIFDVGCGNNSPYLTKAILPDCEYTGIDIEDYNQAKPNLADNYIMTTPSEFSTEIAKHSHTYDAVISAHNLEHCDDRDATLHAMLAAVKINGKIFLSFPCMKSIHFPPRYGTLNYFDDYTHKTNPPDFDAVIDTLLKNNFQILFSRKQYRPKLLWMLGFLLEPFSKLKKKNLKGTWEYYGFETIILAKRIA
jgi:SAM-dependent methyltransferase